VQSAASPLLVILGDLKMFNRKILASVVTGLSFFGLMSEQASAAVDLTAVTSAGTDAASIGAAVLVVMIGIAAFKWIRKAL
jgi:GTP:adenosylcobinamide-phosphate guanylyltransferase